MRVGTAEGIFPIGRCIGADIIEDGGSGRHALAELLREAFQSFAGQFQCLQTFKGESDAQPCEAMIRVSPRFCRGNVRNDPAQHFAALRRITDSNDAELSAVRRRTRTQNGCLNVANIECNDFCHFSCLAARWVRPRELFSGRTKEKPVRAAKLPGINISFLMCGRLLPIIGKRLHLNGESVDLVKRDDVG